MSSHFNIAISLSLAAAGSDAASDRLDRAVSQRDAALVRVELDKGVDPNRKNPDKLTPLHLAARQGHLEISRLLLEKGADPDRMQDTTARTPLHLAVQHQHEQVTKLLLERGANPNLAALYEKGETLMPLQLAARNGDGEIARLLLRYGARLGSRCSDCGSQLLHLAARTGHVGLARLLLAQGIDSSTPLDGMLPARVAARHGHQELARLLGESKFELKALSAEGTEGQRAQPQARAYVYGSQSSQEVLDRARKWASSFTANLPDFICTQITKRSDNQG